MTNQPGEAAARLGPVPAWFLGPKAEHAATWQELLEFVFADYIHWRRNHFPGDPVVVSRDLRRAHERWLDEVSDDLDLILSELKAHFPFYHPRYLAHMISEQSLPSVLGYFAGMLYNPNNVSEEAAPVTVPLELEAGRMVAEMLGYDPRRVWSHITSGGTVANIEALWIARTVQFVPLILRDLCQRQQLPFTVSTPTSEQGAVDPIHRLHWLRDELAKERFGRRHGGRTLQASTTGTAARADWPGSDQPKIASSSNAGENRAEHLDVR